MEKPCPTMRRSVRRPCDFLTLCSISATLVHFYHRDYFQLLVMCLYSQAKVSIVGELTRVLHTE